MQEYIIYWTDEAFNDLLNIEEFLGKRYSQDIIAGIIISSDQLTNFPFSGTLQELPTAKEYRYLVVGNYKILYSVREYVVYINAVFDTRRDPEKMLKSLEN